MDAKTKVRISGSIAFGVFAAGVGYLLAYEESRSYYGWYLPYVIIVGAIGVLGLQLLIFPEKFLPDRVKDRAG